MFATPAFAQATGAAAPSGGMAFFIQIVPLLLIFVIFYFLLFRPQQQRMKQQRARIDATKKGDNVVTAGGLMGKVTKVETDVVEVEIANGVRVKVVKATLADVTPLGAAKPAND
ncbi:MAG: preprotein translocase subunit YajC [Pseudomonadota bacterium]